MARRDLREIYLRVLTDNPRTARVVHERICSGVLMLHDLPQIGRPGTVPGTRELLAGSSRSFVPTTVQGHGRTHFRDGQVPTRGVSTPIRPDRMRPTLHHLTTSSANGGDYT